MVKSPGKSHHNRISLIEIMRRFPDDATAEAWFVERRWLGGITCPHCGSLNIQTRAKHKSMPFRCREKEYGKRFCARTGTVMEGSKLGFQVWMIATYLMTTSLKSVSSMKLHRDLNINRRSAWFVAHRLRVVLADKGGVVSGPVEIDETHMGGKMKNMHGDKHREARQKPGLGKTIVACARDRATGAVRAPVIEAADKETLGAFIGTHAAPGATIYTDEARAYSRVPNRESVNHSAGEYVRDDGVSTNGVESLWSMLKRGHDGTFHKISPKHLDRYVQEFAARHNMRERDTIDMIGAIAAGGVGKRLRCRELIADNGLASGARA